MRDGDIYFWRYKDVDAHGGFGTYAAYHCKSQKAVVEDGRLLDTYWGTGSDRHVIMPENVDLTFKGNIDELRLISEHHLPLYDTKDVVDMRHPNHSRAPVYVRANATRSAAAMSSHLEGLARQARAEIQMAESRLDQYAEMGVKIASGKLDEVFF